MAHSASSRSDEHEPSPTSSSLTDPVHDEAKAQTSLIAGLHHALLEQCREALHASSRSQSSLSTGGSDISSNVQQAEVNIAAVSNNCIRMHNIRRTDIITSSTGTEDAAEVEDARALLADIVARLCLWAHAADNGKADATSMHSPSLHRSILGLLVVCGRDVQRLLDVWNLNSDSASPGDRGNTSTLDLWLEKSGYILDEEEMVKRKEPQEFDETSSVGSGLSGSNTDEILDSLDENVGLLMDLLPSIEHLPTTKAQTPYTPGSIRGIEVSAPAHAWISQIVDKFSDAPLALSERLGEANWQRFCRLRLNRDESAAKDLEQAKSVFHDSGIGTSTGKATTRAASVASHRSLASSIAADSHHVNSVPPEPEEIALGVPFLCSLCESRVSNLRNRVEWKLHVFHDIKPYICLFSDCSQRLTTFSSRSAWSEHDYNVHRCKVLYRCFDCFFYSENVSEFEDHALEHHAQLTNAQRNAFTAAACQRTVDDLKSWTCPLCQRLGFSSRREFTKHVGRHMEEIALATMPHELYGEDQSDESDESDEPHEPHEPHENEATFASNDDDKSLNLNSKRHAINSADDVSRQTPPLQPGPQPDTARPASAKRSSIFDLLSRDDPLEHPPADMKHWDLAGLSSSHSKIGLQPLHHEYDHMGSAYLHPSPSSNRPETQIDKRNDLGEAASYSEDSLQPSESASSRAKKYKCPYCATGFIGHHSLKSYVLIDGEEEPYVCSICNSRFRRLHDVNRHITIHASERDMCVQCNRSFVIA